MIKKFMIRKVFVNKKTKQASVTISKKEMKKIDPSIKFSDELFVELRILKERR